MKKILFLIVFLISARCYSNSYTFNLDTNKVTLTHIYNALVNAGVFEDSISSMQEACKSYAIAVKCNTSDSVFKVGFNSAMTGYFITESSPPWNYVGEFNSRYQSDMWFRKAYTETTAISVTVKFDRLVR